jgi:KUP system potassium uptake protein
LLHNLKHNAVLHQRNVILTIITSDESHVEAQKRVKVEKLDMGFFRVIAHCGFMEQPDVPELLRICADQGLKMDMAKTTFFLSSETIVMGKNARAAGIALWRTLLFAVMARNAQRATTYFGLPPNRVVELGMQVEL